MERSLPKVLITGVSGFLGSHVCDIFLKDGGYQVIGTVRSLTNEKKIKPLRDAFGANFNKLKLVEADLLDSSSIEKATEGCDYVIHTASPFPINIVKDEQTLIKPAVEGTLAVMRGALKHKVKRVVITASVASIYFKTVPKATYDETDWSDAEACDAYSKSKLLAEKAAWDFIEALPENQKFELVVLNPAFIIGPSLIPGDFSSAKIFKALMNREMPAVPKIMMGVVDVRDCARAHLLALKVVAAKNQRFLLSSKCLWLKDIAMILKETYGKWYNVPTGDMQHWIIKLASWFSSEASLVAKVWGKEAQFENKKSIELLGLNYTDYKESINLMAETLIQLGEIKDKRKVNKNKCGGGL